MKNRIKVLVAASTALDGGMNIHLRSVCDALSSFADVVLLDDQQAASQSWIDSHDFVVRYGWSSVGRGDFAEADFTRHISGRLEKNIFCCCFDATLLSDVAVQQIKAEFRTVWYDSSFSLEKGTPIFSSLAPVVVNPALLDWRSSPNTPSDTFRFLHISNSLYRVKGVDLIEKAFREAFGPNDKVTLRLVLKEKDRGLLFLLDTFKDRLHQLEIIPQYMPHRDIWGLYSSADSYVCASRSETFGLPALEAAASGLPVITHRHGGMRDYIDMINHHEIRGQLVEMPPNVWRNNKASTWFDPSVQDLSDKMKVAFSEKNRFPEQSEALRQKFSIRTAARSLQSFIYN